MASVGRNQPCPCGSGRRYKECHGTLARNSGPAGAAAGSVAATLHAALAAQQRGSLNEARRLYSEALAHAPDHFDAVHMQGVVYYQLGLFEDARRYLELAAKLRPGTAAVMRNRELVETAMRYAAAEREICREVLPRLAPLCAAPDEFRTWFQSTTPIHFVTSSPDRSDVLEALFDLRALCALTSVRCWSEPAEIPGDGDWAGLDIAADVLPRGGVLVICASARTFMHWIGAVGPEHVALVLLDGEPGNVIDRLREITLQGRRRAAILYAKSELRRSIGLPGLVLREAPIGTAS